MLTAGPQAMDLRNGFVLDFCYNPNMVSVHEGVCEGVHEGV